MRYESEKKQHIEFVTSSEELNQKVLQYDRAGGLPLDIKSLDWVHFYVQYVLLKKFLLP